MSNLVQDLVNELEQAKFELNSENQRGSLADANKVARLKSDIERLTKQIEEQEQAAEQQAIMSTVDEMVINGTPLREMFDISNSEMAEMAYRIVSTAWKQSLLEEAEKGKKAANELSEQLKNEKEAKEKLQAERDELAELTSKMKMDIAMLTQELADAQAKRDSAASQLEEAKAEIARLNGQVDDLRKEIAVGATNAPKVIDIGESIEAFKAAKAAAEAARPAIYDVQPLDFKQSKFSAKRADTGEEIEFSYLDKGLYREVTPDEAALFRAEYEAKRNQESVSMDTGEGVELSPPPMQFQDEDTADGLDYEHSGVEMARENATVEERLAALERRVTALECGRY